MATTHNVEEQEKMLVEAKVALEEMHAQLETKVLPLLTHEEHLVSDQVCWVSMELASLARVLAAVRRRRFDH